MKTLGSKSELNSCQKRTRTVQRSNHGLDFQEKKKKNAYMQSSADP